MSEWKNVYVMVHKLFSAVRINIKHVFFWKLSMDNIFAADDDDNN